MTSAVPTAQQILAALKQGARGAGDMRRKLDRVFCESPARPVLR